MEEKLRRYKNNLITGGRGLIAFGMWNTFKVLISILTGETDLHAQLEDASNSMGDASGVLGIGAVVLSYLILMLPVLIMYIYTGSSAYKEGMGIKKKSFYLFVAAIMILTNSFEIILYIVGAISDEFEFLLSSIPSILIDITTLLLLVDIMYSAVMSRHLSKGA